MSKQKVFIIYANLGGGHKSLAKYFEKFISDSPVLTNYETSLIDIFEDRPHVNNLLQLAYTYVTSNFKIFWNVFFALTDLHLSRVILHHIYSTSVEGKIKKLIEQEPEAKFVFTYYPPKSSHLGKHNLHVAIPDPYSSSRFIFTFRDGNFHAQSEHIYRLGLKAGLSDDQIKIAGLFLPESINSEMIPQVPQLKSEFSKKRILITSGGQGLNKSLRILKKLASNPNLEIDFVAGKNMPLEIKAQRFKEKFNHENVTIYGFTDQMKRLMQESDLIITKAGPNTMFEALKCKKPLIIFDYLWKQELGNLEYVTENNLGIYEPNPSKILEVIESGAIFNSERAIFDASIDTVSPEYLHSIFH